MARAVNNTIKKAAVFSLKLAVTIASFYYVFSKADIWKTINTLGDISLTHFFIATILYIFSQLAAARRWMIILPGKYKYRRLFSLYMIGAFFSRFLPGVVGGDAVRAYYLYREGGKMGVTIASIFMDRYLGYLSLIFIGMLVFPFVYSYFGNTLYKWSMPVIFGIFIIASLLFFGLQLGKRFRTMSEFYDYFYSLWQEKAVITKALFWSAIVQILNFIMVFILAIGTGEKMPLLLVMGFLPIIITISSLPISISGLGIREGSFVFFLGLIGIRPETATSLSLAWFFSVFLGSLPGLMIYLIYRRD